MNVDGQPVRLESDWRTFGRDGTWAIFSHGTERERGPVVWDSKGSPGTLDLARPAANGPANLPALARARYRLDGDTLTLSIGHGPTGRPADLDPGKGVTVWLLKRVRDK